MTGHSRAEHSYDPHRFAIGFTKSTDRPRYRGWARHIALLEERTPPIDLVAHLRLDWEELDMVFHDPRPFRRLPPPAELTWSR
jgi:hypothetical protein